MTKLSLAFAAVISLLVLSGCSLDGEDDGSVNATTAAVPSSRHSSTHCRDVGADAGTAIVAPTLVVVREWKLDAAANLFPALGCLAADGEPVEGARIRVNNYLVPDATDSNGGFYFPMDVTRPQRATVTVAAASAARIGGDEASESQRRAVAEATGALIVRFKLTELEAERTAEGIRVTGRASYDDGSPPPAVVLYAYELSGKVIDEDGNPLGGAIVATRSLDLELWSFSSPSAPDGAYRSFFLPSGDETDKVGFTMRVAVGDNTYEVPNDAVIFFDKLKSAELDLQVPPVGFPLIPGTPRAVVGAVFEGLLIGVTADGESVTPVAARWPDDAGRFELVLPESAAGKTVRFWQSRLRAFSRTEARPGGPVDVGYWPDEVPDDAPFDLEALELPG